MMMRIQRKDLARGIVMNKIPTWNLTGTLNKRDTEMHELEKMESGLNQTYHNPCYQTIGQVEFYSFKCV
ncbi:hypothetical protein CIPAW_16G112700 [Carya illinoinensis]|uniref:Uncharacterized protein n=1 Tax=Carya illinoinensis TaxID=32201 RepID=A0A8T1N303_CARIL|nr:hypothetical protein CIPAW_16G112700 [Carya illinoinensis]